MPKPARPGPRPSRAKAARPEVHPLDDHLAALLNPALVDKPQAFGEAPQARFAPVAEPHPRGLTGATASAEVAQDVARARRP